MKKVILLVIALASVSALSGCVWPFWGPGGGGPGHMGPGGGGSGGGPHR